MTVEQPSSQSVVEKVTEAEPLCLLQGPVGASAQDLTEDEEAEAVDEDIVDEAAAEDEDDEAEVEDDENTELVSRRDVENLCFSFPFVYLKY